MKLLREHGLHDQVCFGGPGARTHAQLLSYVDAIAARLPTTSAPDSRVVLACVDRYHFTASLLAVWQRGLTAALPPNGQVETVRDLRAMAGVVELLHDRDESEGLDVRSCEPSLDQEPMGARAYEPALAPAQPALVVYTSGSTGEPTPHAKSLAQLLAEPAMWIEHFALGKRRVVSAVPAHHIYGLLFGVLAPLLGGGAMSRRTPVMPSEVLHEIADAKAHVLVAVPPHLRALAAYQSEPWPLLERVFSSAAPLPEATDAALVARGVRATQVLGSTETGGIGLRQSCSESWRALPSVSLETDGEGCLLVRSPWASADGKQVRTADRVQLSESGFTHLGRADSVVKVGGKRVDLREIEQRLCALPGITDARVLEAGTPSPRGLELWAVVECEQPEKLRVSELKQALSAHVESVVMPRRFRLVGALPRGASGKVTRADLLALFEIWQIAVEELPGGRYRVPITAELGYFRGHFPNQPVLAGVVQIQRIALKQMRRRWPDLGVVERVTRVKFKRLVTPGEILTLSLTRKGDNQVSFQLTTGGAEPNGESPVSSGVLHFRKSASETDATQARSIHE
jgi:4-coumarate--CoA ligase (photoactive yellow protein activation family)